MKYVILIIATIFAFSQNLFSQSNYWSRPSPYELNLKKDLIIGGLSIGTLITGVQVEKNEVTPTFVPGSFTQPDIDEINSFDRGFAGRWDMDAKDAGKIFKTTGQRIAPLALLALPGSWKSRSKLAAMYLEGYFLNGGLVTLAKGSTARYRPFTYQNQAQIDGLTGRAKENFWEDIADDDIEDSFYSGDAASTSFGMIFFAKVFNDYYPESKWRYGVWGASIVGTGLGAYFRAKSGKHFPSDVVVGSIVGGGLGFLIPHLHKKKDKPLSVVPSGDGVSLVYRLK